MRRFTLVLLLLIVPAWSNGLAGGESLTKTKRYVGMGYRTQQLGCQEDASGSIQFAGACWSIPEGLRHIEVSVVDDVVSPPSGFISYYVPPPAEPEFFWIPFCNGSFSGDLPEFAEAVYVELGPHEGELPLGTGCSEDPTKGQAVTGTISIAFSAVS